MHKKRMTPQQEDQIRQYLKGKIESVQVVNTNCIGKLYLFDN